MNFLWDGIWNGLDLIVWGIAWVLVTYWVCYVTRRGK